MIKYKCKEQETSRGVHGKALYKSVTKEEQAGVQVVAIKCIKHWRLSR